MQATRRFWALTSVGAFLASYGVVVDRPSLVLGAAMVGAWLIAHQVLFARALADAVDELAVAARPARSQVSIDTETAVTLTATLDTPASVALSFELDLPNAATGGERSERTVTIQPGEPGATTTIPVSWPIGGEFRVGPAAVTAHDSAGLFREQFAHGDAATVTVRPRTVSDIHVGSGGDRLATAFGSHSAGHLGAGLDPAELRPYTPGDPAGRIDWKATARLTEPYVREFEADTDRRTVLVFDQRATLGDGPSGGTKLDYLRHVALAYVESTQRRDDPLGYYALDERGLTAKQPPRTARDRYTRIRTALHDLEPSPRPSRNGAPASTARSQPGVRDRTGPAAARRMATRLAGDSTAFGRTLREYASTARSYVTRIEERPLFETIRTQQSPLSGTVWTVIFSDDVERDELREAVKVARRGDDHVLVFLTPTVLFEVDGLADVETAYRRYVDFEEFRLSLDRLDRVAAFEVAPGDRLDAVLADRRRRRATGDRPGTEASADGDGTGSTTAGGGGLEL